LRGNSSGDTGSETSEEDYDNLKHDPATVVGGGKGGGYGAEAEKKHVTIGLNGNGNSNGNGSGYKTYEALKVPSSRPGAPRLKSIPVTLNKLKEEGRYILTADDEALKEILRSGLERVCY
jgi:sterol O-acyltransferase